MSVVSFDASAFPVRTFRIVDVFNALNISQARLIQTIGNWNKIISQSSHTSSQSNLLPFKQVFLSLDARKSNEHTHLPALHTALSILQSVSLLQASSRTVTLFIRFWGLHECSLSPHVQSPFTHVASFPNTSMQSSFLVHFTWKLLLAETENTNVAIIELIKKEICSQILCRSSECHGITKLFGKAISSNCWIEKLNISGSTRSFSCWKNVRILFFQNVYECVLISIFTITLLCR